MDVKRFKRLPVMGILRGAGSGAILPLVDSVIGAGLETLEITMNTPGAASLIRSAVKAAGGRLAVGAGTILDTGSLKAALEAGATFIVMPALISPVVDYCVKKKIPVFPGALTPQEVYDAWRAGAAMVKVFPAGVFGPSYFKELKGPFDEIELMAVGGVRPDNIKDYFTSGAGAVAFGASVFRKELLDKSDFTAIGRLVSEYIAAAKCALKIKRAYETR